MEKHWVLFLPCDWEKGLCSNIVGRDCGFEHADYPYYYSFAGGPICEMYDAGGQEWERCPTNELACFCISGEDSEVIKQADEILAKYGISGVELHNPMIRLHPLGDPSSTMSLIEFRMMVENPDPDPGSESGYVFSMPCDPEEGPHCRDFIAGIYCEHCKRRRAEFPISEELAEALTILLERGDCDWKIEDRRRLYNLDEIKDLHQYGALQK